MPESHSKVVARGRENSDLEGLSYWGLIGVKGTGQGGHRLTISLPKPVPESPIAPKLLGITGWGVAEENMQPVVLFHHLHLAPLCSCLLPGPYLHLFSWTFFWSPCLFWGLLRKFHSCYTRCNDTDPFLFLFWKNNPWERGQELTYHTSSHSKVFSQIKSCYLLWDRVYILLACKKKAVKFLALNCNVSFLF